MKNLKAKTLILTLTLSASGCGLNAQTLLYEFNFNDSGNATGTTSTGSNTTEAVFDGAATRGADGSGVSGLAGDYAFDMTAPDAMGNSATSNKNAAATASSASGASGFGGSTSFTITGWAKAESTPGSFARIIQFGSYNAIYLPNSDALTLAFRQGDGSAGTETLNESSSLFDTTDEWVFFATSYDGTTGLTSIYAGSKTDSVSLLGTATFDPDTVHTTSETLLIGNSSGYNRPYDGLLDDLRVYTDGGAADASGALSLGDLEGIRANAIPELSTSSMFVGFFAILLVFLRRSRFGDR
ncbi:LamG domain-containing protein [Puniceicoccus vermicola]|uniref:LamG domain-containing protein n=1 Tax=Puniceicoccus vermicola TaxID=388746 RepID=A0A7X1B2X4_9BACT|nr:LamG domain-containing protein [Puniceicoccus vermicola]MBC2604404.1 LamG domain-containing protein [Puniceicoccus vermicola]